MATSNVLIVSKGHAYNHDAFLAMFEEDEDIETTLVEQPAAQIILQPYEVAARRSTGPSDQNVIPAIAARLGPDKGKSRYLYRLFPEGPAKQVCRYAGLPKPVSCI